MAKAIKEFIKSLVPEKHAWKVKLFHAWPEIIGELSSKVSIEEIKDHALILAVSHSAWAQELSFLTPLLKEKINTALGQDLVHEIRFRVHQPRQPKGTVGAASGQGANSLRPWQRKQYTLSMLEQRSLDRLHDAELKDALKNFLVHSKQRSTK